MQKGTIPNTVLRFIALLVPRKTPLWVVSCMFLLLVLWFLIDTQKMVSSARFKYKRHPWFSELEKMF